MKKSVMAAAILSLVVAIGAAVVGRSAAQQPDLVWHKEEKIDAFRGTHYLQFTLDGRFLSPPKNSSSFPLLVVHCLPEKHSVGYHVFTNGRRLASYLIVGPVLDSHLSGLTVQYRLDDGKIQTEKWGISTDFSSAFFPDTTLNNLLYGHILPHKENSSAPVRKLVIATDEFVGGEIVMQFDMPDPESVAEACGIVIHKQPK
jgi:hypothetical protein